MAKVLRTNRIASDEDIIRYNSVGMSYASISKLLGCHPTTVQKRLESLGIPAADTRRTFMEDVYNSLSLAHQTWLENQLGPHISVKDFVRNLLIQEYVRQRQSNTSNGATQDAG